MKWFFEKGKENIPQRIDYIFSDLRKKDFLEILMVFDEKGVCVYSIVKDCFFQEEDAQNLLNLFRLSDRVITESISENALILLKKLLNYEVSSINVKFGAFRLWLIKSSKYYLIAIVDEMLKELNVRNFENLLLQKLSELERLQLIESYD
ncbi:MAG: hypothetical protein ABGX27_01330 [Desulfurobacteriaceae bacterium]